MLTPEQITAIRDQAGHLVDPVQDYLLRDIARRVSTAGQLTSTAAYQVWRAQQMGLSRREIEAEVQRLLGVSASEVETLLTQAAEVGYDFDLSRLPSETAATFAENEALQSIVHAAVQMTGADFSNITQTLGLIDPVGKVLPLREAYTSTMDYAFELVSTGATDYNTAIRMATRNLAERGLVTIDYASGIHTSLDAAVRRCVMGGLGLMVEQTQQLTHDQLGCDGWEISAHAASAPDHEPIQGKQYTDAEYKALNSSLRRRIGTLNCGHVAFPIILGVNAPQYSKKDLQDLREDNDQGISYEGRHYTTYEATQHQRKLERTLRAQKRRVLVSEASGDKEQLTVNQIRLQRLRQEYKRFSKAAGLRTQAERISKAGFGRSSAAKAVAVERKLGKDDLKLYELDITRRRRLSNHPELAVPGVQEAVLEEAKFTKYLFDPNNQRGWAKGVAITSRLGYDVSSWKEFVEEIRSRAPLFPARAKGDDGHGMKYEQRLILFGKNGRPTNVIVAWIIEDGKPRMTSVYLKEVGKK